MASLIDDLLDLARVARAEMALEQVDLSALAQAVAADLMRAEPDRPASFVIAPGLKATGDVRLLRLVLENLLGNAWKFTRQRPAAVIELGARPVTTAAAPTTFFVRDNGAGFDMAYASRLFTAFQRLHTTVDFPGTGVGLATVRRIIDRHRGRIWAEATVGDGATFFFTLGLD